MELTQDQNENQYQIQSYEPGKFTVDKKIYTQSIIISSTQLILWEPKSFNDLTEKNLSEIIALKPNIVLLGTGLKQMFPPGNLLAPFAKSYIGVEIMNTAAACRTFNVLVSENRNVVAGLLIT